MSPSTTYLAPRIYRMLAHPLRHQIVIKLAEGPASTVQLAQRLGETEERVREQIKILRSEDPPLVELMEVRPGPKGGNMYIYRARRVSLDAGAWEDLGEVEQATQTATILQTLWGEVKRSFQAGRFYSHPKHHLSRFSLNCDEEAIEEVDALLLATRQGLLEIERRSAERRAATGERPKRVITALKSFLAAPADRPPEQE